MKRFLIYAIFLLSLVGCTSAKVCDRDTLVAVASETQEAARVAKLQFARCLSQEPGATDQAVACDDVVKKLDNIVAITQKLEEEANK